MLTINTFAKSLSYTKLNMFITSISLLVLTSMNIKAKADSLTISPISFTMHGIEPGTGEKMFMSNKLDGDARYAMHPGLSLVYKKDYMQYTVGYLRDCFNHHAGYAALGPKIDFLKYFSVGGILGLYVRETTKGMATEVNIPGGLSFKPVTLNKLPFTHTVAGVDLVPMGAATVSATLPLTKSVGFETNIMSNFYLNHVSFGVKIEF